MRRVEAGMTTSQRPQSSRPKAGHSDMEFQTPAVLEKSQSRFGWRPNRADSADTGLGTTTSDSAEELCSSSSSPSFQPIRSQIPIPTAHVMPSTAGVTAASARSSSSSSKSSLSKSASSPNLEVQGGVTAEGSGVKQDCLSRYRSLVNGLDHSLFPMADHTRLDEEHHFETPAMEPTLNQSGLLGGLLGGYSPDVRMQLHMTGLGDSAECRTDGYSGILEQTFKILPEARTGIPCSSDPCGKRSVPPVPAHTVDPSGWQQHKQKLESLRLQVEQMQLMTGGSSQYPSLYPSALQTESKWEAVVKANENLLKEKELIIERQKQQLCQLEQRLRESEVQIHSALMGRGAPFTDICMLRLQEAQRENAFLRSQFAECSDSLAQEKVEAERRLAAVETETHRLSEVLKESKEKHTEELKKQEERIRNRDKHINSLKKKCQKECEQNREKQQRIETLERYLADLPTMEDYQSQRKQLEAAEQKVGELQAAVLELQTQLEESRSANRSKDSQLEEQRRRERELLNTVTSLQARVQESLEDGARLPSLDIERLREENVALKEEQQKLKKVIEKQLRMMEQLGSQIRNMQQHLSEEESSGQALRDELDAKEKELLQLHSAVKELSVQNQDLMEQTVTLRERLQATAGSGDGCVRWEADCSLQPAEVQLTQKLYREMEACLSDLRSLCSVLTHTAQGQDPNLSMLLGISSAPAVSEQSEDWLSPAVLQRKLQEALQLRRDVEALRTTVSDRYAQDMGENCTTQ
ncbi:centrosomal protein of 85 kDa isoform X2 [Pygocentrus nattereri]|uniref:Centrosomal protein of 85 kDa-like CC4 coiled-coil domain-containing protein n=1 Tax=Pygocentrus nattereri TaxID=42514 RepID=A0A3B4CX60_PYGNA|nr:centrosomal protein of 85 kDa isoform X2 [Pygocentrus nattereri]